MHIIYIYTGFVRYVFDGRHKESCEVRNMRGIKIKQKKERDGEKKENWSRNFSENK